MLKYIIIISVALTACDRAESEDSNAAVTPDGPAAADTPAMDSPGESADGAGESAGTPVPGPEATSPTPSVPFDGDSLVEGRPCPPDNKTTYANTGAPILLSWCVSCHSSHVPASQRQGAPVGVDFDTIEGITDHLERIYARSGDANVTMPPVDAMSADERTRLGDWIACGAPGLDTAELPEPGDGAEVSGDGSAGADTGGMRPSRPDDGMGADMGAGQGARDDNMDGGGRPDSGMSAGPDSGESAGCADDADCEAECVRLPMGCSCLETDDGGGVCAFNCDEDDDCPGDRLVCVDSFCERV